MIPLRLQQALNKHTRLTNELRQLETVTLPKLRREYADANGFLVLPSVPSLKSQINVSRLSQ